jgi:hypothetical protein
MGRMKEGEVSRTGGAFYEAFEPNNLAMQEL